MPFLDKTDLLNYIDSVQLEQLTGGDDDIITDAILDAEETLKECLSPRFDMSTELTKTAGDRNRSLLRNAIHIAIYYLFTRIPSNITPESREVQFIQATEWLRKAYKGEIDVALAENDATNKQGYSIQWGSKEKKGPFNW